MTQYLNSTNIFGDNTIPVRAIATVDVWTLFAEETLEKAVQIMSEKRISSILVIDRNAHPIGIITERNILHALRNSDSPNALLKDIMTSPIVSVSSEMSCQEAYLLCLRKGIRHLAMLDANGHIAGVITETDFRLHMNLEILAGLRPVSSVMVRTVLTQKPDASLKDITRLMDDYNDTCVVVVENKKPVGILTERDIVRLYANRAGLTLRDVMSSPVCTLPMNATINAAANLMFEKGLRHLVVVDQDGLLVGFVSEHDLTQAMAIAFIDAGMETERSFLRALIDSIPDLVWLKNPEGVYLACNRRFESFFGAHEIDIVGKTDHDFVSKELADFFRKNDQQAITNGNPTINEEWITFASDGHRELLETIKTPMYDAAGGLIGVLGIGRDITQARQAQDTIRDSEERLRTLLEAIPDSIQFKDNEGRWLAYNSSAARAFGLEGIDCHGKNDTELSEITDPLYKEALLECRRTDTAALRAGKIVRVEESVQQADGSSIYYEVIKVPLELRGELKGLVIIARDNSKLRTINLALEKSLEDFNKLVSTIPVGVFKFRTLKDGSRKFEYVSPRWSEMTGIPAEKAYADVDGVFRHAHPEDLEAFLNAIKIAIDRQSLFTWEGRILHGNEIRWSHIEATPLVLKNGDIEWNGTQYDVTERKHVEEWLALVDFALDHITDAAFLADFEGNLQYVNQEACRSTGYDRAELLQRSITEVAANLTLAEWKTSWENTKKKGTSAFESIYKKKDGDSYPVEIHATYFEYGGQSYILGLVRDIREKKKNEESLRLAASVFTGTHEGIVITDTGGRILDVNDAFSRITGYEKKEVIGQNPNLLKSGNHDETFYKKMWDDLKQKRYWSGEIWNRGKSGIVYAEHLTISAVCNEHDEITHYVGVFTDITPLKEHELQLEQIAHYDSLTGVPNRVLLTDRMNQAIAQTMRSRKQFAVCYIDLDGFKPVNDKYGHTTGDRILIEMANRIKSFLRGGDTISRIGGDEFILLLLDLGRIEDCHAALNRILEAIVKPILVEGQKIIISASVGVTLFPEDRSNADTLLRHADQAMYQAKSSGKNRYLMFDPEYDRILRRNRAQLERLQEAVKRREFVLYYQPRVDMNNGEILCTEALIRWQHPEKGLLLPTDFLPVLEGSGIEVELGEWVIESALSQVEIWHKMGLTIAVSVNIGANHLLKSNFAERLQSILALHPDTPADSLELEILESTAIADIEQASRALVACRKLGVSFSLDDFGTGFSSLTYFRRLPVQTLKIDKSFVSGMLEDPEDRGIVESVIRLAQTFNRSVVAEGVETDEHCSILARMGCSAGQGYGIARPMPPGDLLNWIAVWREQKKWVGFLTMSLPERPEDLVIKAAMESHRAWVEQVIQFIQNPEHSRCPTTDSHLCRFGVWYHGIGLNRYGYSSEFASIDAVHEEIHTLAKRICFLAKTGNQAKALSRVDEILKSSDRFIKAMEHFIATLE